MYELIEITKDTFYIDCPAKIGIYRVNDEEVYLIDSGNDIESGKKVASIFNKKGWKLKAILNTHSNADHIGGNKVLMKRMGVECYSSRIEQTFIENTILESSFLYGGYPCKMLRNKFLMADSISSKSLKEAKLPEGFEVIPLPGHFFDMVGFKTPDNVVFLADCIFGENILNKYHVSFIYDIKRYLETLDYIQTIQAKAFVPAHAPVCEDISALSEINRNKIIQISNDLIAICKEPKGFDDILASVFNLYSLSMDFNQNVLVGSTIKSYLSYLFDLGKISVDFKDNILRYRVI